jgi:hypothetical protein
VVGWVSDSSNDRDADGCNDALEDDDVPFNILETIRSSTALTMLFVAAIVMLALLALSKSGGASGDGSLLKGRKRKPRPQLPNESWALLDEKDPAPPKSRSRKAHPKTAKPTKPPADEPEPPGSGPGETERAEEILEELESAPSETSIDDLWDIADGKPPTPPPPSESPESEPVLDESPSEPDGSEDPEDPVTWLRLAGKMAAEGRHEEAEACRKTAMDLMQQNR